MTRPNATQHNMRTTIKRIKNYILLTRCVRTCHNKAHGQKIGMHSGDSRQENSLKGQWRAEEVRGVLKAIFFSRDDISLS